MAKKQKKLDDITKKFGDEREKALNDALKLIEKDFGKGSIMRLGERAEQKVQVMSSGSLALDIALGAGGYPKGRILEIYGPESTGKTSLSPAFSINSFANSTLSASTNEFPISIPLAL